MVQPFCSRLLNNHQWTTTTCIISVPSPFIIWFSSWWMFCLWMDKRKKFRFFIALVFATGHKRKINVTILWWNFWYCIKWGNAYILHTIVWGPRQKNKNKKISLGRPKDNKTQSIFFYFFIVCVCELILNLMLCGEVFRFRPFRENCFFLFSLSVVFRDVRLQRSSSGLFVLMFEKILSYIHRRTTIQ